MATPKATAAFLSRARGIHPSNIRSFGPLRTSSVGFGGYRVGVEDETHHDAILAAVRAGVNLIDTAPSYQTGKSEQLVASALRQLVEQDEVGRENLVVCTKVGYIEGPELEAARANEPAEVLKLSEDSWHCIHPDYIEYQLDQSSKRLETEPDVVLLHSPEFFMTAAPAEIRKKGREAVTEAFYDRVSAAFQRLEKLVKAGRIKHCYGVSSSLMGCDYSVTGRPNLYEGPSLRRLLSVAEDAARRAGTADDKQGFGEPGHRMRMAQIPLNLVESGPVLQTLFDPDTPPETPGGEKGRFVTALEAAEAKGMFIVGNRPINAIAPEGIGAGDWGRGETFWKLIEKTPLSPELSLMKQRIQVAVGGGDTRMDDFHEMQHLALWAASSANGIGAELCGARTPRYVEDVKKVLAQPRLDPEESTRVFQAVRELLIELNPSHAKLWD